MAFVSPITSRFIARPVTLRRTQTTSVRPNTGFARITPRAATYTAREVSAEELETVLQANERPLLVDAFAQWCGPCQYLIPQLDIVADKFGDRLDILKFNTELYPDLSSALMIRGLPTLFFIKDGKLLYRMEGALSAEQLEKLVDYVLFDGPQPDFSTDNLQAT
ncbi:Thioredoxin Y, chloroplastic [Gracilariopsis chorda]|uniref:Thioredoxin Y, chloroplastic n=1 Tax=Gracilariopsis chorda TaxID=448386 RepID=A0A2V3IZQ5_9FLOR|nr:Thioredoxin Y, chloroplastic [Gracilariopsis chorda]|eukprot:PXF47579.1 Thioredoxin Y, chloroplastic [Gracilariopsis chorda]